MLDKMPQLKGSLVLEFRVPEPGGQFLAMLKIRLRGVETEGEILGGHVHFQIEPAGRVLGTAAEFTESIHLVQFAGHVHFPRFHEAVQFVQLPPKVSVRPGQASARHRKDNGRA